MMAHRTSLAALVVLLSSALMARSAILDIAIKEFINEDPDGEFYRRCGIVPGSNCEGCEKWPVTPTSDPMRSFDKAKDATCRYLHCGLQGGDPVAIESLRLFVEDGVCKLDTDDVAATVVEGNKCGYSFRRVCPAAMRTVPILWAQFKCNEADRCRESTDTAFTTFNDYVLLNGCAYAGPSIVRHVPAPSWLFPGAPAANTPAVCVPCGHVGMPICPEGPYCADRNFAPTVGPEAHCQNKLALACGLIGLPSCQASGLLPTRVDADRDGCIDADGELQSVELAGNKTPVNCGGTCAACTAGADCAAFCKASGLGDLITGPAGPPRPPVGGTCAGKWQQCGGFAFWKGPTCCTGGLDCVVQREGYSQCRPDAGAPPPVDPPVEPPVSETCAGKWQRCGGFAFWKGPTCCTGDLECVFQREGFSQCRPPKAGPPTSPPPVAPPAGSCAAEWGKCGGSSRYTGSTCCASGLVCVVKSPYYSQCLRT